MAKLSDQFANAAHQDAASVLAALPTLDIGGAKVTAIDFANLKIIIENSMIRGANLYRDRLVEAGVIPEL